MAEVNLDKHRRRTVGGSLPRSISTRVIPVLNGIIKHSGRTCTTLSIWGKEPSGLTRPALAPNARPSSPSATVARNSREIARDRGGSSLPPCHYKCGGTHAARNEETFLCWTCRFSRPSVIRDQGSLQSYTSGLRATRFICTAMLNIKLELTLYTKYVKEME
jgi:hypothetical protein